MRSSAARVASESDGEAAVEIAQAIGRQHAGAAAVGEDGQPVARELWTPRQDLGGAEQIVELAHAQQPSPAESGLVGGIGSGQRSRVR